MAVRSYTYALGYLRAFVIVLVVAHHSALGYLPYAPPPQSTLLVPPPIWQGIPVLDAHRWFGSLVLVIFNDNFFMSLMFFLSGLFFWQGLQRKGTAQFLQDRLLRLGIPFLFMAALFSPIAYYPSYLQTTAHTGLHGFWSQWRQLPGWPAGPGWFIWLLLLFDSVAAGLFTARPALAPALGRLTTRFTRTPLSAFVGLSLVSILTYVPMAAVLSAAAWTGWGPFSFQTSRILLYFAYFLLAVGLGAAGLDGGILAPGSALARRWLAMTAAAIVALVAALAFAFLGARLPGHAVWAAILLAISCAASSLAFTAIFLRFMQQPRSGWTSLAANSYGIYVVHYMLVSWTQYALLPVSVSAVLKFAVVLTVALLLSWGFSAAVRRWPPVARML